MPTKARGIRQLEEGDLFFFYRPRVGVEEVRGREDVQRLYMVLAAKRPRKVYRLFVIGRKKLPELTPGQHPERRNWALNILVTDDPDDIRRELAAVQYTTETRGERFVPSARPVAEGRYLLVRHGDHAELAYALELPRKPGPAQEVFGIKDEASLIVAVKNPDLPTPGAPSPPEPPAYPPELRAKFGARRWIDAEPELLDYENSQLLLLAAREGEEVEEDLGIHIDTEEEALAAAEVFRELRLSRERERVKPLLTGEFPEKKGSPEEEPLVRRLDREDSPPFVCPYDGEVFETRSRYERHMASAHPPSAVSAADIEKALAGIDYPKRKSELVEYAAGRVPPDSEVLRLLRMLPDRTYRNAADVAKGFGELKAKGAGEHAAGTAP